VRFELGAYALKPEVKVIAPWREWNLTSRERCWPTPPSITFRSSTEGQEVAVLDGCEPAAHLYEGGVLEDPWAEPEEDMWRWTFRPRKAPTSRPTSNSRTRRAMSSPSRQGHEPGHGAGNTQQGRRANGIGRADIVENRYVGMKSRARMRRRAAPSCSRRTAPWNPSPSTAKLRISRMI